MPLILEDKEEAIRELKRWYYERQELLESAIYQSLCKSEGTRDRESNVTNCNGVSCAFCPLEDERSLNRMSIEEWKHFLAGHPIYIKGD